MNFEYVTKFLPFDLFRTKSVSDGPISIDGYGSVFRLKDLQNDVVMPGAFTESLHEHRRKGSMPSMLWQHQKGNFCGRWLSASEDHYGLHLSGLVDPNTVAGSQAIKSITLNNVSGLSIGFYVDKFDKSSDVRYIRKANLVEISLVINPANVGSRFTFDPISSLLRDSRSASARSCTNLS